MNRSAFFLVAACAAAVSGASALTAPRLAQAPVIDGRMAPGEWDRALSLRGATPLSDARTGRSAPDPRRADVALTWDDGFFYLAARAETAPGGRLVIAKGVHNVYFDDCFEFWFDPPPSVRRDEAKRFGRFQLVVNPLGDTFVRHYDPGYGLPAANWKTKGIRIANTVADDVWTCEIALPKEILGGGVFRAGDEWGFLAARNFRTAPYQNAVMTPWNGRHFDQPGAHARVRFAPAGTPAAPSCVGAVADGALYPRADGLTDADVWKGLEACVRPCDITDVAVDGFLKWYPSLGAVVVDLKIDPALRARRFSLILEDAAGKNLLTAPVDFASSPLTTVRGRKRFAYRQTFRPESPLADGRYRIRVAAQDGTDTLTRDIEVKSFPWLGTDVGKADLILPGFTPLAVSGRTVSCVLRDYAIAPCGLPESVVSLGREILARPVALVAEKNGVARRLGDGNTLAFPRVGATAVDYRSAGADVSIAGRVEQDGLIRVELDFPRPPDADRVYVDIRLKKEFALLFHACGEAARSNPAGFIPSRPGVVFKSADIPQTNYENFIPYLWAGTDDRGISYVADTDEGWVHGGGRSAVELVRHADGEVSIRLNLLNARADAADLRTIVFALQASPVKKQPEGWRGWAEGFDYTGTRNANCVWSPNQWGSYTDWAARYPAFEDWNFVSNMTRTVRTGLYARGFFDAWTNRVFAAPARDVPWVKAAAKPSAGAAMLYNGLKRMRERVFSLYGKPDPVFYFYTCNRERPDALAENAFFGDEWGESGSVTVGSPSYRDFALWNFARALEAGMNGIYNDNTYTFCNFSWATGDAWIDRGGNVRPSYNIWRYREYHRRQAVAMLERGIDPWITVHHTDSCILPVFSWVKNTMGMEWSYGTTDFQTRFTPDYIRAVCQGTQGGFFPTALDGILTVPDRAERTRVSRTMLASLLPHGVRPTIPRRSDHAEIASVLQRLVDWGIGERDCVYTAYYDAANPVAVSDTNALVSVYRRGDRFLAVCGSWADRDLDLALTLESGQTPRTAVDLETGAAHVRRGADVTVRLRRHDLALVEIDCGPDRALYVDNVKGDDANDGSAARPFRTIARGLARLAPGGMLRLVANAEPYREGVSITAAHSGRPGAPTVIDGGGAVIDGFTTDVNWSDEGGGVYSTHLDNNAWPMDADGCWCGAFPIVRFGETPGVNVRSRADLRPGRYFLFKKKGDPRHNTLYVATPDARPPRDVPVWTFANRVNVRLSKCSDVRVSNVVVRHQPWDCFSLNWTTNCVLENLDGSYAMDQGISNHSCVGTRVRRSRFHHNTGGGIVDVNLTRFPFSSTLYENCTIDSNMYRCPLEFYGKIHGAAGVPDSVGWYRLVNCRIFGNDLSRSGGRDFRKDGHAYVEFIDCERPDHD